MSPPHEDAAEPVAHPRPEATSGLPAGYREGVVTATTFLLGFGLAFVRFWAFAPGAWTAANLLEGIPLLVGVGLLLWALFRALDPADEGHRHYRTTRHVLLLGIILMFLAVVIASLTGAVGTAPES
jgi:ABC-type tungstate transport system substrate-binding protein